MTFSRLSLRRLAACMLASWVLALGASVAHACGLSAHVAVAGHGDVVTPTAASVVPMPLAVHGHEQPRNAAEALCLKFCAEEKASAPSLAIPSVPAAPALINSLPPSVLHDAVPLQTRRLAWRLEQGRRPTRSTLIDLQRLIL
ncbi:hypothetical protein BURK1_00513 [Burkholderiales bacterium]|nr:hypothetical protein BURK1_00513 [Burkholderiales bacterium]